MLSPVACLETNLPSTPAQVYSMVEQMAVMPSSVRLPKVDMTRVFAEFSTEWKLDPPSNCTELLTSDHNRSAELVEDALERIRDRSLANPKSIHYLLMDEYNIEAMNIANVLLQFNEEITNGPSAPDGRIMIVCGKHLLHCCAYMAGSNIRFYDIKKRDKVAMILKSFAPGLECAMCLVEFDDVQTKIPFECGHPMCMSCAGRAMMELTVCPTCRCPKKWSNLL